MEKTQRGHFVSGDRFRSAWRMNKDLPEVGVSLHQINYIEAHDNISFGGYGNVSLEFFPERKEVIVRQDDMVTARLDYENGKVLNRDTDEEQEYSPSPQHRPFGGLFQSPELKTKEPAFLKVSSDDGKVLIHLVDRFGEILPAGYVLAISPEGLKLFRSVSPNSAPFPLDSDGRIELISD